MGNKGFSILLAIIGGLIIFGILGGALYVLQNRQSLPSPSAIPGGDYGSSSSPTPFQTVNPSPKLDKNCLPTSCHGLDITCGSDGPKACTAIYSLGDRCRQFARCQVVDGDCQLVKDEEFETCKSCVKNCVKQYQKDGIKQFDCESKC